MKSSAKNIKLTSVDDLFSTEESRIDERLEKIVELPLAELFPFKDHPFKVIDNESMLETAESIKQYGVLVPAIARPRDEGGYELVAGHRRKRACELAELETMPVIVRNLDDDAAIIIMVDSNLQRENILPSERAFAYKMKLNAVKNQGARNDLTSRQLVGKLETADIVGKESGDSGRQVQRYIRLTHLIPELLSLICKDGIDSINGGIRELEANGYVIRRRLRNEKGQLTTTEYTIFEQPQTLDTNDIQPKGENPILGNPIQGKPIQENPILDKPKQGEPILGNPHQLSTNILNTDLLNIEVSNPYPSNPYQTSRELQNPIRYDGIGCDSVEEVRELVLENLEYEYIKNNHNRERLDEIVDLMVETLCSTKATINVAGDDYPAQLVKEKLLRINCLHIEYVFECLDKTTTYIRNIKRYLLATLFNAPSTIDNYYSALVNHDLHRNP